MHWLANPDIQALIATFAAFVWLTHIQAALPPSLEARIPAPLLALLRVAAGNWGNAKNTQAPMGPASPLASIAITALCACAALLPQLVTKPAPAPVVSVPVAPGLALPHDVTATALPVQHTAQ